MAGEINNTGVENTNLPSTGVTDSGGQPNTAAPATQEEWFLDLGDGRTRYKTKEDAVKGYASAGQRIAALTPWERAASQYGVNDPRQVSQLFDELIKLRGEMSKANQVKPTATATPQDAERAEVEKFLSEYMDKNGYVRKDAIEPLTQNLQTLNDSQFEARVGEGRSTLKEMLTEAKLPTDPKFSGFVENYLRAYIDADDSRVQAFYSGGEAMKNMLKEGFGSVMEAMGLVRQVDTATAAGTAANYVDKKNNNAAGGNRTLPQHDIGGGGAAGGAGGDKPKPGFTTQTHDAAWEVFKKFSGQGK